MLKFVTDQTSYDIDVTSTAGVDMNTNMISLHVVGWTCIVCAGVCTDIEFIVGMQWL